MNHTTDETTIKLCECGCGKPSPIAKRTDRSRGMIAGQPLRFIKGHYGKTQTQTSTKEKFWSKVDVLGPDDCWEWNASLSSNGYGVLKVDGVTTNAQRISWELHFGTIPTDGHGNTLHVLHRCDNRRCCNPRHLFLGTHKQNMLDRNQKQRQARQVGRANPSTKLTTEKVLEIRATAKEGTQRKQIAESYGVSLSLVEKIISRAVWKHV